MKSRKRILRILNHNIPYRVPIDLISTRISRIPTIAYNKLILKIGYKTALPKMYDVVQQLVYPDMYISKMFNDDIINAG